MPSQHVLTQEEWVAAMAKRAMDRIRSELYLDLRYMNAALGALVPTPAAGLHNLATDGAALCYDPEWFIGLYRSNRRYLPRAVLHSVLHCVFRHPWLRGGRDASLWGLACDIAVEQTIDALQVPSLTRPVGWLRQKTYQALRKNGAMPAAGPIYRWLAAQEPDELQKLHREFVCDSHRLWPKDPTSQQAQVQGRRWEQLGRETRISMQQAGQQAGQAAAPAGPPASLHTAQDAVASLRAAAVLRQGIAHPTLLALFTGHLPVQRKNLHHMYLLRHSALCLHLHYRSPGPPRPVADLSLIHISEPTRP